MSKNNETYKSKNVIRAHISELTFNNGEKLEIRANDIVLFVGPNNVGKSQSLKDIFSRCCSNSQTIVISNLSIIKEGESLRPLLDTISKGKDSGAYVNYTILGRGLTYDKNYGDTQFLRDYNLGSYREAFVTQLSTENRLGICVPAPIINRNAIKLNPIQFAAFDYKYAKWLSDSFHKAFGNDLMPNTQHGATIPLCIGPMVKLNKEYKNEMERQSDYATILESYKQLHEQGDGIKSFTGILLYLMLDYYCTYLIDEPELFLHPPQARIMGQIIGETLRENQQAFISTHSEEIVKGLLDVCEDRLKIVRITRKGDTNAFSVLDNVKIKEVFGDPLLKYSNIMSGLFHKTVVLCESDSDCKLYSLIENHIKQADGMYSETLFIHCGGKHRMAKTATALLALNVDVRLIPDIDILNDENIIKQISKVFGINLDNIKTDIHILTSNLHSHKERINRSNARAEINRVLDSANDDNLSNGEINKIRDIVKTISKWDIIKHGGKQSIPAGDATNAYNRLDCIFREHNIYIVSEGELENFVKEVGGHGPDWVNRLLEEYPDLDNVVYQKVRDFIRSIEL